MRNHFLYIICLLCFYKVAAQNETLQLSNPFVSYPSIFFRDSMEVKMKFDMIVGEDSGAAMNLPACLNWLLAVDLKLLKTSGVILNSIGSVCETESLIAAINTIMSSFFIFRSYG